MKKQYTQNQIKESATSDAYEIECMLRIVDDIRNNCPNDRIELIYGAEINGGNFYSLIKNFNAGSYTSLNSKLTLIFPNIKDIETVDWFVVHTGSRAYTSDILIISRINKHLKPVSGMPEMNTYKYGSIEIKRYKSSNLFLPKFILKNDHGHVAFSLSHAYMSLFNEGFNNVEDIILDAIYSSDEYVNFNRLFLYTVANLIGVDASLGYDQFNTKISNSGLSFNDPKVLQAYIDRTKSNYIMKNVKISNFELLLAKYYFNAYSEGFRLTPFMLIGNGKLALLFKLNLSEKTINLYDPLNLKSFAKSFSDVFSSINLSIRIRPEMKYKIVADMYFSSKLAKDAYSYDPNGNLPPKRTFE